ncbi:aminotransferase class V-fold PLP-dependent enzyme [Streptomyces sp. NBC_01142]|uniref:pyridoxal phosphate-dependent decarboxylase family protein n=1 Tax=Streptomyces sp. NBC_01142 TaxID=2975865 RepID=UPI002256E67C|nr:aminotransferase class I/II-fold pyridoxal phosphate-dependent enzyme [Streptomyces sp. NBC_01142]MCX4822366.1 aminotransferase class V-fold PLP-dependent enzyme [Streptomyces sp. NBC_01142]
MSTLPPGPPLAGGIAGPDGLRPLLAVVLDALRDGATARGGPLPAGGPDAVTAWVREAAEPVLPEHGTGAEEALRTLVTAVARGAADPADPLCAAHLHTPPLALAVAADLAASALNPSMDSWDQAPAASELEAVLTRALAAEVYPHAKDPDALVTTGGTESNQLGLLLARERHGAVQVICGAGTHHSVQRAAWLLGLPEPVLVPGPSDGLDLAALDQALTDLHGPLLVAATAGTTDTGRIDPLAEIADLCERHRAELHIDAAYGGPLLFSQEHRARLAGLERAHSVTLDLHKLGWQPVAAGLLAVPDRAGLAALGHTADYLNADDDTEAGLPDLLGRSLRTTRRPDILKVAVTLRALGRTGLGALVDRTCAAARQLADLVEKTPGLELYERPPISTVLFRPTGATDEQTAAIRRTLLTGGRAVIGRARADGRLWLKATLLNPHATPGDLTALIQEVLIELVLVEGGTPDDRHARNRTRPAS